MTEKQGTDTMTDLRPSWHPSTCAASQPTRGGEVPFIRWIEDPIFSMAKEILLSNPSRIESNKRREWYENLPKTKHPFDDESADFRCLTLDQTEIGKIWLSYVLDGSTAKGASFLGTRFQGASIIGCDFTGARFEIAQMSPVFAELATFRVVSI
ncbi:pentapeptide repeat-containing protein [Ideonella livida]|uniref:Pentapeptide repeat-containing protein n=1 Tax=Ideonella livida TaxID=2707176 RepID=A0A7C9TM93_9BURK|nr:pentapeptide repeat-containing protein [Ideonella livida]NDY93738.1 pentapeptide repeat-containing protein [Ideonella livida]